MSRARRVALIAGGAAVAVPALLTVAYLIWRPRPPAGAPRIGLSMASSFVIQRPAYEAALARAGGEPVLLTPVDDAGQIDAMLDDVDALLLTGGDDIDPALYGGEPGDASSYDHQRDAFEIALIHGALDRNMPVLGICRGIQILNVAHGGSIRNLRDDAALLDRHGIGTDSFSAHKVRIEAGSQLACAIGAGDHEVNSFHGQAVGRVGQDLLACAVAEDGVVEGIERPDCTFVVAVQWHPEITSLTDRAALALYEEFVRQAEAYRGARGVRARAAGRESTR